MSLNYIIIYFKFTLSIVDSRYFAKAFKLPNLKQIFIDRIPENNENLLHFLEYSSPSKTKTFVFGWEGNLFKLDFYLSGLEKALPSVTEEIFLKSWTLSNKAFERVVRASANATKIIFRSSKIDCSTDFNFSGPTYNTKYFGLPW